MVDLAQEFQSDLCKRALIAKEFADETALQDDLKVVESFLNENGFSKLSVIGAGTNAIALVDRDNPNLVFRLAVDHGAEFGADVRAVSPYVLQPIFVKLFETHLPVRLEILPFLEVGVEKNGLHRFFLEQELDATRAYGKLSNSNDFGVFRYTERGQENEVWMAVDDSVFRGKQENKCTANYPSLAIQQAKQQELWEADKRLQKLLPNGPVPLPETRIVPSTERGGWEMGKPS